MTAPLVLIPDPDAPPSAGCTPADFAGVDIKGKIALIQRGTCSFGIKNENAKNAGAVGVVGMLFYSLKYLAYTILTKYDDSVQ